MFSIQRVEEPGAVTLIVSGRIGAAELPGLRELVQAERVTDLVLDLTEVSLVDAAVVRFLVSCEAQGGRLVHCPAYVREWMLRERGTAED